MRSVASCRASRIFLDQYRNPRWIHALRRDLSGYLIHDQAPGGAGLTRLGSLLTDCLHACSTVRVLSPLAL